MGSGRVRGPGQCSRFRGRLHHNGSAQAVVGTFSFNGPVPAPLIARDLRAVGASGFGALMAAFGAGSLAAGIGLVILGGTNDRRIISSAGILALTLILPGLSPSYPVSLVLMGLAGLSGTVFTTTSNTRLQGLVPDRLRGRVMSLFVLLMAGTTPIGASLLGPGADAFGVSTTITGFGAATTVGLAALVLHRRITDRSHLDGRPRRTARPASITTSRQRTRA